MVSSARSAQGTDLGCQARVVLDEGNVMVLGGSGYFAVSDRPDVAPERVHKACRETLLTVCVANLGRFRFLCFEAPISRPFSDRKTWTIFEDRL